MGTGLPTADNTHEVAQRVAPDARIVYVDNDPLVLAHARALMDAAAPGSYLLIGDNIEEGLDDAVREAQEKDEATGAMAYNYRPAAELRSLFDGLEWVDPGFVSVTLWRPERPEGVPAIGEPEPLKRTFGGLARKPGGAGNP